ncbi:MAG: c-type cytochrome [Nitrosomonadales bacterium]|nr:c-type cytochrome [Nitrosomonadales bacterium]
MKVRYLVALTAALSVSTAAVASSDGEALFKKSNCGTCHAAAKKTVGPSIKDIALKYAGVQGAAAKLEAKVRNGGSGAFGSMPMPATPKSVSDESIKTIVEWTLSQK